MIKHWTAPNDNSKWIVVTDSTGEILSMIEEQQGMLLIQLVTQAVKDSVAANDDVDQQN